MNRSVSPPPRRISGIVAGSGVVQASAGLVQFWRTLFCMPWQSSVVGRLLILLFARNVDLQASTSRGAKWLLGSIPALGMAGLLLACGNLGTGKLALGVGMLSAWILLFSFFTGKNRLALKPHLLDFLVLLFFATYIVAAGFSSFTQAAFIGLAKQGVYLLAYFSFRSTWAMAPLLSHLGFLALFGLGLWQSVAGWLQHQGYTGELAGWTDYETPNELRISRIYGTIKPYNPNLLAAVLLNCIWASVWLLFQGVMLPFKKLWPWLLLGMLALGGMLVALLWTGCRGAYIGLALGMAMLFLLLLPLIKTDEGLRKKRWLPWAWGALAVLGLGGLTAGTLSNEKILNRVQSIFAFREDSSISYRMNVYISAWRMFADNWLVGIGPSNTVFKKVYGFYMMPGYNALGAYSVPLEIMVEQGILGLMAWLFLLHAAAHEGLKCLFDGRLHLSTKLSLLVLGASFIATLGHGLFDTILYRPPVMLSTLFLVAAFVTHLEQAQVISKST